MWVSHSAQHTQGYSDQKKKLYPITPHPPTLTPPHPTQHLTRPLSINPDKMKFSTVAVLGMSTAAEAFVAPSAGTYGGEVCVCLASMSKRLTPLSDMSLCVTSGRYLTLVGVRCSVPWCTAGEIPSSQVAGVEFRMPVFFAGEPSAKEPQQGGRIQQPYQQPVPVTWCMLAFRCIGGTRSCLCRSWLVYSNTPCASQRKNDLARRTRSVSNDRAEVPH